MTGLRITSVSSSYGPGDPVLDGVDLTVPEGEVAALLGPSGCGKTTLLRVIAGFLDPDAGEVSVGGRTVSGPGVRIPPQRRGIGLVAQEGALFPHLSVARNVAFGLRGAPRGERRSRTAEMLELVGLGDFGERMPHELSGGQQQRVALARALAPRPALVLLDEPFNALDSGLRAGLRSDVRTALRAAGATALLVTHDQEEALSSADRVAVLRAGRVVQCAPPEELYARPADPWVASFVGAAVRLPGTLDAVDADGAGVGVGRAVTALGPVTVTDPDAGAAERVGTVVLRPEHLRLVPSAEAGPDTPTGRVTEVRFHGHDALVLVAVAQTGTVTVRVPGPVTVRPGDVVGVRVAGNGTFHRG
ncbi:ABC transporter ATP-binding protein [Streptomyces sp. NPDC059578]|uniref:ABC transporter ATP-binding protein n=1 Tax=unclassified Streptomyces TaxID=2593676 RepID=UPI00364DF1D5